MKFSKLISILLAFIISVPSMAFSTIDEQIDSYLKLLAQPGREEEKQTMLERLQWSGLSDPRLYDPIEAYLLENGTNTSKAVDSETRVVMAHMLRALGYSGNEKYRSTLKQFESKGALGYLRRYARKGAIDLPQFENWNRLIAASTINVEGKTAEVANYMRMLSVDDIFVQRLAARAIFHERQTDKDLIALTAEKLKLIYLDKSLNKEAVDTAAWYCKAIGQSSNTDFDELLGKVAADSPHRKIQKYARKYL